MVTTWVLLLLENHSTLLLPHKAWSMASLRPVTDANKPQMGVKMGMNIATLLWYMEYSLGYLLREIDSENKVEEKNRVQSTKQGASG